MYNIKPIYGVLANAFVLGVFIFTFSNTACLNKKNTSSCFINDAEFPPMD